MSDTALVIVARYPEQGKIKTRLAQSIGNEETLRLYKAFLADLAQKFVGWVYDLHWAYTPSEADFATFAATLAPSPVMQSFPQDGPELGTRLHNIFHVTRSCQFQHTIILSSDVPQIRRATILHARQALDHADVVLGPAEDGGYYLIAMKEAHDVFSNIPMSTAAVLQMTLDKVRNQGLSVQLLEPLFDIDELPDLQRLAHLLQTDHSLAPVTAALLRQEINAPIYSQKG